MECGHIDPDNMNDDGNCQSIGSIDQCSLSLTKRGLASSVTHPASVYALSAMTGIRGVSTPLNLTELIARSSKFPTKQSSSSRPA